MQLHDSTAHKACEQEQARLAMLADYQLDLGNNEEDLDHIVRLAAELFDMPIALISIIDEHHQNFKAARGVGIKQSDRSTSFCQYVIVSRQPMVVEDASLDPRFVDNPHVNGTYRMRFYAAAPLLVEDGHALGTLCLVDNKPRQFSDDDMRLLVDLATIVSDRMELRRSERKRQANEQHLADLAHFDPLTGLANRGHFRTQAQLLLDGKQKQDLHAAVILLDIDSFRSATGLLGDRIGDEILKTLSSRMVNSSRGGLYARIGDDDFAIFQPNVYDPLVVQQGAVAFRKELQAGLDVCGQCVSIDVSIGYALYPNDGEDIETLMANAQLALRAAKKSGSGIHAFQRQLRTAVEQRKEMETDIRRAVDADEFELFYQPQIDLSTDRIIGAEALLRWRHPEHGLLTPGHFLSTLESMPLSVQVGEKSVLSAIAQADLWRRQGTPIRVSVNLFASQFLSDHLVEAIGEQLASHELPPELLEIELTETVAIDSGKRVINTLQRLSDMGVCIALDDFGTGHASLTALKTIPVQRLKIDREFVTGAPVSDEDAAVVEAVILLGKRLGFAITAEGVEKAEEESWLRHAGCFEVQGYRYGRPMPAAELTARLANGSPPPLKIAL